MLLLLWLLFLWKQYAFVLCIWFYLISPSILWPATRNPLCLPIHLFKSFSDSQCGRVDGALEWSQRFWVQVLVLLLTTGLSFLNLSFFTCKFQRAWVRWSFLSLSASHPLINGSIPVLPPKIVLWYLDLPIISQIQMLTFTVQINHSTTQHLCLHVLLDISLGPHLNLLNWERGGVLLACWFFFFNSLDANGLATNCGHKWPISFSGHISVMRDITLMCDISDIATSPWYISLWCMISLCHLKKRLEKHNFCII